MEARRTILYFILAILGVMLWHAWTLDHPAASTTAAAQVATAHPSDFAPTSYGGTNSSPYQATEKTAQTVAAESKFITIKTDLVDARINLRGGNLVDVSLLKYPLSLKDKNPVQILNANHDALYVAQSGLSTANSQAPAQPLMFAAAQTAYTMADGQDTLVVTLNGKSAEGIAVQKTFTFTRNSYAIATAMKLTNTAGSAWSGNVYNQLSRRNVPAGSAMTSRSYSGAAVSTPDTPYKKLTFDSLSESDFSSDIDNGWIAMQQQYFLSAWVPDKNQTLHYYSRSFGGGEHGVNNVFILGYLSQPMTLAPKASASFDGTLYVGPEIAKNLLPLAKGLDLTVDYGWLWPISKFLFWLMSKIHRFIGNWGWSIILVTLLVKAAFYGLSNKSYASMAKTRDLQPKINLLRERHGDDKQALSRAMMDLYRKEKINPLGGCLPMVVQIPVFIALYYVLIESVQLRQAPFVLWIHDLSVMDPYFILPVLMGISMLVQQKLSPPPPDPAQAKMMMFLPIVFTVFFCTFPAGLVLYWLTNNCASILQQWFAMKRHHKQKNSAS